jgi:hypothetical protein
LVDLFECIIITQWPFKWPFKYSVSKMKHLRMWKCCAWSRLNTPQEPMIDKYRAVGKLWLMGDNWVLSTWNWSSATWIRSLDTKPMATN